MKKLNIDVLEVKVCKQIVYVAQKQCIVSGTRNVYRCSIEFDDEWNGFDITVIFKNGNIEEAVRLNGKEILLPNSVIVPGKLRISAVGVKESKVITTKKADGVIVAKGILSPLDERSGRIEFV